MHNSLLPREMIPPAASSPPASEPANAPRLLEILWRRRWALVLTVVFCAAAAAAYLLLATPVYLATARVTVSQSSPKSYSDNYGYGPPSDTYLQTEAEVIQSAPVLRQALDAVSYRRMRTFARVPADVISWLRRGNGFKVDVARRSDVISVSMESPYSAEAAAFVNAVVDAYLAAQSRQSRATGGEMMQALQAEQQELQHKRDEVLRAMLKVKQDAGALSFREDRTNVPLERAASLAASLTAAEINTMELRAQQQSIQKAMADPASLSAFVAAQQLRGKDWGDREYDELRSQLNQLSLTLSTTMELQGPNHPRVRVMQFLLDSLKARVAAKERAMADAALVAASTQLAAAEAKERQLRDAAQAQRGEAMGLTPAAMEYARLEADANQLQKQIDTVGARVAEVSVNNIETRPLNVRVLDPARVDERPVKPNKTLTLAATLMTSMLLGLGMALLRERRDSRLRRPEEIQVLLGMPVLATVPRINVKLNPVARGQTVLLDGRSVVAEAYRSVRASLQLGGVGASKTILVASPAQGDGKSTTASNLAIAFAEAGERTLLIDCDLREPAQHLIFGTAGAVGLTSVIASEAKLRTAVCRTAVPGLYLLPCGPVPENPSELLAGKRLTHLMQALGDTFDRVIIDSPPLMRFTDARILAASADVTLLVFRMNQSMRPLGVVAMTALEHIGARVVGAIANDVPSGKGSNYYGGSWQYAIHSRRLPPAAPVTSPSKNGEAEAEATAAASTAADGNGNSAAAAATVAAPDECLTINEPDWAGTR